MIETLLKAGAGMSLIVGCLIVVQTWLGKVNDTPAGEDPLAGRLGCNGCGCATPCERDNAATP